MQTLNIFTILQNELNVENRIDKTNLFEWYAFVSNKRIAGQIPRKTFQ